MVSLEFNKREAAKLILYSIGLSIGDVARWFFGNWKNILIDALSLILLLGYLTALTWTALTLMGS